MQIFKNLVLGQICFVLILLVFGYVYVSQDQPAYKSMSFNDTLIELETIAKGDIIDRSLKFVNHTLTKEEIHRIENLECRLPDIDPWHEHVLPFINKNRVSVIVLGFFHRR